MEISRRDLLAGVGGLVASSALPSEAPLISRADLSFLRELAAKTIASATRTESVAHVGFPVVTPGGNYPAFWIRDFSMAAGCGLIDSKTLGNHLRLVAKSQRYTPRKAGDVPVFTHGRRTIERALIPEDSIPDHINFDGGAVFFPGTYSSGDAQGGEPFGKLPPIDDHFEFIHLAYLLWKQTKSVAFLNERVGEFTLFERLVKALECPVSALDNRMVFASKEERAVGFGFCDTVYLTGFLLFPALLEYRALGEMAALAKALGRADRAKDFLADQKLVGADIVPTFYERGWLKAATEIGQQPDVWGTIYALYLGIPKGAKRKELLETVRDAVKRGTITYKGAVRHVPTDRDFSATSAWERTAGVPRNRYQNGAYWHVATGWLAKVLWQIDKPLARSVVSEMVAHYRDEDFRKGEGRGAPWECLHPTHKYRQNPVYMASVTLPLEALLA